MQSQHSESHSSASFGQRCAAGWLAGACGEMLYGHPLSTIQAHMEHSLAYRLLRPSLRGLIFEAADSNVGKITKLLNTGVLLQRRDGWKAFYRGASIPVLASSLVGAAGFATYGEIRPWLCNELSWGRRQSAIFAGAVSGLVASAALAPLEFLTIRYQLATPSSGFAPAQAATWSERFSLRMLLLLYGEPLLSPRDVLQRMGWRSLWAAAGPTALREMCCYGAYYAAYEDTSGFLKTLGCLEWVQTSIGGAAAGAAGVVCAQPLHAIVGIRHQDLERKLKGHVIEPSPARAIVKRLICDGGVTRLFCGIEVALLRAVPFHAVVFLVYEFAVHSFFGQSKA